jgi:hypothetical protein
MSALRWYNYATIFRQQHKIERKQYGGNAALLFATFSSNDLVVSEVQMDSKPILSFCGYLICFNSVIRSLI